MFKNLCVIERFFNRDTNCGLDVNNVCVRDVTDCVLEDKADVYL